MRSARAIVCSLLVSFGVQNARATPASDCMAEHVIAEERSVQVQVTTGLRFSFVPFLVLRKERVPRHILAKKAACARSAVCVGTANGPWGLGDLVTMRMPSAMPRFTDAERARFAIAFVSQDGKVAEEVLAPLASQSDPNRAYLAALATIQVKAKVHESVSSLEADVKRLWAIAGRSGMDVPVSDLHFLQGLMEFERRRFEATLASAERAIAIEPSFLNAHLLRLDALLAQAVVARDDEPTCLRNTSRLVEALASLTDLAPCPQQMTFVDLMFDPLTNDRRLSPGLFLTKAYFAKIGRHPAAVTAWVRAYRDLVAGHPIPRSCDAVMVDELRGIEQDEPIE